MTAQVERVSFSDMNLEDAFFRSLRNDYRGFPRWFASKADEQAYVLRDETELLGFMYLKPEDGPIDDVEPAMQAARRLKIGTLKIEAHGSRLGQRFIKKALDHAIYESAEEIYVTVFPKHEALVALLEEFGFSRYGTKTSEDGTEAVLVKSLATVSGIPRFDYPRFQIAGNRKFILPIQPQWHTKLFPDSILTNESYDVVKDIAHTNSIEKSYICFMDASEVCPGDLLLIYRTSDGKGSAEYRSVATSICTAEEIRCKSSFSNQGEFVAYCKKASVFDEDALLRLWRSNKQRELVVVRMLYNAALTRRLIRKSLIEDVGIKRDAYPGFLQLTDQQFGVILELGGIHESLVIN